MGNTGTPDSAGALSDGVWRNIAPPNTVFDGVCQRDCGVEVSSRNGTKREYQRDQSCACGDGVSQECDGDVAACQTFPHDPRSDHGCDQEQRPQKLCCQ